MKAAIKPFAGPVMALLMGSAAIAQSAKQTPTGEATTQPANAAPVKVVLVGDSTVATGGGWGPGFCAVMAANVTCIDDALNGCSTKSFIDEGAWKLSRRQPAKLR